MSAIFGMRSLGKSGHDSLDFDLLTGTVRTCTSAEACCCVLPEISLGCSTACSRETSLLTHGDTGVTVVSQVRLDNRDELFERFRVRRSQEVSDSGLILEGYLQEGEGFVEHLLGDWTFAVWDPRHRKMVIGRDHHGMSPMYYHAGAHSLSFCSSIKGLLAIPSIPKRPNLLHISKALATWPADGIQTAYDEIARLAAGHVLVSTPGTLRIHRYWTPSEALWTKFDTEEEHFEAFLELYSEAVRCRMRSSKRVGVTLSGGLDSGSVASLAARELARDGNVLQAFTSAPAYTPHSKELQFGDERPFVEANREFFGNLDVHYIRAEHISPMQGIERALDLLEEPLHGASNAFWIIGILEAAKEHGTESLLTGLSGNLTASWEGDRKPKAAAGVARRLIAPWARPLRNKLRRLENGNQDAWMVSSPLNPAFVRKMELDRLRREDGHNPNFVQPSDAKQRRLDGILMALKLTGGYFNELAAPYGVTITDPTMDKRIIEFCLAAPIGLFQRDGVDRRLIRVGMKDLLPDKVRLNRMRGAQAADLGHRILAILPEVESVITSLESNTLANEVLDLPKMKGVLGELKSGVNPLNTKRSGTILMRGLMAGRLLARF